MPRNARGSYCQTRRCYLFPLEANARIARKGIFVYAHAAPSVRDFCTIDILLKVFFEKRQRRAERDRVSRRIQHVPLAFQDALDKRIDVTGWNIFHIVNITAHCKRSVCDVLNSLSTLVNFARQKHAAAGYMPQRGARNGCDGRMRGNALRPTLRRYVLRILRGDFNKRRHRAAVRIFRSRRHSFGSSVGGRNAIPVQENEGDTLPHDVQK